MATSIGSEPFPGEAHRARAETASATNSSGVTNSAAAVEDTVSDAAAVVDDSECAASVVRADIFRGTLFSQYNMKSLAACASVANPAHLSLVAVKELLHAWQTIRGSLATSWAAGGSRFQRLLLFSPRGDPRFPPLCRLCTRAKAAALSSSGHISAVRDVADLPQPRVEDAARKLSAGHISCGPVLGSPNGQALAFSGICSVAQQKKAPKAGRSPSTAAVAARPHEPGDAAAADVDNHVSPLNRRTVGTVEGPNFSNEVVTETSSCISNNKCPLRQHLGRHHLSENKGGASLRQQPGYEKTKYSPVVGNSTTPLGIPAACAPPETNVTPCASPFADRQHFPSGLDMLASFEGLLWKQRRAMWRSQTGQSTRSDDEAQRRPLQQQVKKAVLRGVLLRRGRKIRKTLLDWREPYARDGWIDISDCQLSGVQDASAQTASESAIALAQKALPAPHGVLSAVPQLHGTSQPAGPVPFLEAVAGSPALSKGIRGTRSVAADELKRRVVLASMGEPPVSYSSHTAVKAEAYRPSREAAAALEVNWVRACLEATADALLHPNPPPAGEKAEQCSRVFCVLAEVDGSLFLMQQQQMDCLRRIYERVRRVIMNFLNKTVNVASLQSYDFHGCETLYFSDRHISSCNRIVTSSSSESPIEDLKTAKNQEQHGAPGGGALMPGVNDSLWRAADSTGRADNGVALMADTGISARVISRLEILLGLHVTCEALLQKVYCDDAIFTRASTIADTVGAAMITGRTATMPQSEKKASDFVDGLTAEATDRRLPGGEVSEASSKKDEKAFSHRKATYLHENGEPQDRPVLQSVTSSLCAAAERRDISIDYSGTALGGLSGKKTIKSVKTMEEAPVLGDNLGDVDTGVAPGEVTTSSSGESHSGTGSNFPVCPRAKSQVVEEITEGSTSRSLLILRRAALQCTQAVTAEILQACGKLLQQLLCVDQAIQEALSVSTDLRYNTKEKKGNYMTETDAPAQGSILASFLKPLELPNAAAALHSIGTLQEAIRKRL